ncbi:hypothetical protein NLI96_g1343 [Meripilus lineatus]|uniref:LCCL domain-containing protein n=1 Tax=Meripilus lineatus TaxID=2056292 RepID=A0AAD5YMX5_9APHY|nr:hypothetical protein NLI96_g1343 [Physisporinus lineatus]
METPMSSGSSSGTHYLDAKVSPSDPPKSPKFTPEQSFDYEELGTRQQSSSSPPRLARYGRIFGVNHPRVQKVWRYLRGPRPKVDLPDPLPILDRTYSFKAWSFRVAIESALLRATHPFTPLWIFTILAIGYIIGFAFFSRAQSFLTPSGSFIDCTATYWAANNGCGLDGELCAPFDNSTFDFRCPAQCSSVVLQNPRTVGDEQVNFVPLIVGGGDANHTYRGDSFICAAAVQAGLISDSKGGCASLQIVGNFTDYQPLTARGLSSIGFPSVFPLSFQFLPTTSLSHCEDMRDGALAFNILVTALIFLVLRPKPIVAFWALVCIGFWHVTLFSQPRTNPPVLDDAFGTFLPALFCAYAFWRLAYRFTMEAFRKAPIEACVWYVGPFWVGVLSNLTLDKIPINRLVASDIASRPGALTALIIIIVIFYPDWNFGLHHYILSMVLIPGTAFPTRLSAVYQGFLLGLFLNGVAAFGFDSILQTAEDLRRDGVFRSPLPDFLTNSTTYNASIPLANQTIAWDPLPDPSQGWDGFALLVDDVERYIGSGLNFSLASLKEGIPHFFRLAFTSGGQAGDFTMPATLWPNGTWVDPLPGPS